MLTKKQKFLTILSANILIFLAIFILLEAAVRLFLPESYPLGNETRQYWRYDSLLGWAHQGGMNGIQRIRDQEVRISINSHGLRDDEIGYARNFKNRILLLGDSFGWGFGINREFRMSELIEGQIDSLEIINASVAGYSTDQQLLYYENEGYKYQADAVVVLFCENDFLGNTVPRIHWYNKPFFTYEDDTLLLRNVPVPELTYYQRLRKFLSGKSHFLSFMLKRISFINASSYANEDMDITHTAVITEKLLSCLQTSVKANNAELILIAIPMSEVPLSILQGIAQRNQINFLDLSPFFIDQKDFIIPDDGHWNNRGNKIAADAIIQAINGGLLERR